MTEKNFLRGAKPVLKSVCSRYCRHTLCYIPKMKSQTALIYLTIFVFLLSAGCQTDTMTPVWSVKKEQLPPCPGNTVNAPIWTNCQGLYYLTNGQKYLGDIVDGNPNGQGTMMFEAPHLSAGNKYIGEFKDKKFNGQGTYFFANGDQYVGEFKDNKFNGKGTITFTNGDKYVGEFKNDKKNGSFIVTFADGDKYVGELKEDKKHGLGSYTHSNGNKYVGEFRDDKFNGQGTYIRANGKIIEGVWENNKFKSVKKVSLSSNNKRLNQEHLEHLESLVKKSLIIKSEALARRKVITDNK
jgi:hypothetical protein